jgi:hypothetical protein
MPAKKPHSHEAPSRTLAHREVLIRVLLETFDLYIRSVAEIAAETGLPGLTVETLMAYCLALPEADELIYGFIRGDLAHLTDQVRDLLKRDTRRLELEPAGPGPGGRAATPLARKLSVPAHGGRRADADLGSNLDNFIRDNLETFRQVDGSPKPFLVRWVMLHLMERAQARERGQRAVHEFFANHPEYSERLRALAIRQASSSGETPFRLCP